MRIVDPVERRARMAVRHHLAARARTDDVTQVAGDLLGLHATDPATVYLSAAARMSSPAIDAVADALYERRSLVRMLGMRRTMFVVPTDTMPIVQAACTNDVAAKERKRAIKFLTDAGHVDDPDTWLRDVERRTLAALEARGEAAATELADDVPELRDQIEVGVGTKWPATISVSSRVLLLLSSDGRIVRGRPRGSWISTQYRWVPVSGWLGAEPEIPDTAAARTALLRRWLWTFGPATIDDIRWWTGWTLTQVRRALADVATVEVGIDGTTGLLLADDAVPVPPVEPWARLLPALDPTPMGWKQRDWYLGTHRDALFDRSGNIGPTIWWDGRIVGGWAQRPDGEIVTRLLEDVGAEARAAIDAEVEQLTKLLDQRRFVPKFRTPLERELST